MTSDVAQIKRAPCIKKKQRFSTDVQDAYLESLLSLLVILSSSRIRACVNQPKAPIRIEDYDVIVTVSFVIRIDGFGGVASMESLSVALK